MRAIAALVLMLAGSSWADGAVGTIQQKGNWPPGIKMLGPKDRWQRSSPPITPSLLDQPRGSLTFREATVSSALEKLFEKKGSYVVLPGVTGLVSAKIREGTFGEILHAIVLSVGATYRLEGEMVVLCPLKVRPVAWKFEQADVRDALRTIFRSTSRNYSIAPEVQGPVTADVDGFGFEHALRVLLREIGATYRVSSGVIEIVPRTPSRF